MCSWGPSLLMSQDIPEHQTKCVLEGHFFITVFSKVDHHNFVWWRYTAVFTRRKFLLDSQILIWKNRTGQAESEQSMPQFSKLLFSRVVSRKTVYESSREEDSISNLYKQRLIPRCWLKLMWNTSHPVLRKNDASVWQRRETEIPLNARLIQRDLIIRCKGT